MKVRERGKRGLYKGEKRHDTKGEEGENGKN